MDYWFYACPAVEAVEGMGNLKTCTSMHFTFVSCLALTTLDLRGFVPTGLTDVVYAFAGCSALTTIYADEGFALRSAAANSFGTFNSCSALVGGAGTTFSSSMTKGMYMRIDGGTSSPGYLTAG